MKKSALKFLFVGIGAFFIDYSLTLLLHYLFGITGYIASAIGFSTGFIFSFTLSREWVFKHKESYKYSTRFQLIIYFILAIVNLIISTIVVAALGIIKVDLYISKIFITVLIALWNYLISHYIIFIEDRNKTNFRREIDE